MLEAHLWKFLGRHPSLDFAIQGAAQALRQALPLHSLAVRWLDLEHGVLTTVAEDSVLAQPGPSPARVECSSLDRDRLLEWCRRGEPLAGRDGDPLLMDKLAGPNIPDDVLAGPLDDEHHGTPGALLLFASSGTFTAEHTSTLAPLLAPFRVALATDRRFHELSRMREAFEADNRALLSRLDRQALGEDLVGADGGLAAVLRRIDQVAPTEVPVLILGETGTGKELLARAIHQRSSRPSGPMVKVNCGAIPTGLVDSELFGHERGSFTGAVATRAGWFERADGGTLFLDEIGELPLEAQVRLLRVLQEGVIERVGGSRPVHVDVRLVAAKTCGTASPPSPWSCRRCATAPRTSGPWPPTSPRAPAGAWAAPRSRPRAKTWSCSSPTAGPATCASSPRWWSGRPSWGAAGGSTSPAPSASAP
jgi:hydrogenase-4 transcriptional activator